MSSLILRPILKILVFLGRFGSVITIAAAVGGPIGGLLVEKFGRKGTILVSSVPSLIGWLMLAYFE